MAADHHTGPAPWRELRTAPLRHRLGCRSDDCPLADHPAWLEGRGGRAKSDAGDRTVALDAETVADLRRHRREQDIERKNAGDDWNDSGFEFTDEQGGRLHPADVTYAFHMIAYLAGLSPIRLHDLRHGAATLLLAAGYDLKVVQETLGLSSITIAADTYTSVLPQLARRSAEDVAALIRPANAPPSRPRPGQATGATTRTTAVRSARRFCVRWHRARWLGPVCCLQGLETMSAGFGDSARDHHVAYLHLSRSVTVL